MTSNLFLLRPILLEISGLRFPAYNINLFSDEWKVSNNIIIRPTKQIINRHVHAFYYYENSHLARTPARMPLRKKAEAYTYLPSPPSFRNTCDHKGSGREDIFPPRVNFIKTKHCTTLYNHPPKTFMPRVPNTTLPDTMQSISM